MVIKKTTGKYFEAVGRRKSAVARVRLFNHVRDRKSKISVGSQRDPVSNVVNKSKEKGQIDINQKKMEEAVSLGELQNIIKFPFKITKMEKEFYVSVKVSGGGIKSQAEAIRLGISRALIKFNPDFRKALKAEGFLTRDSRVKERKKFGLKKARKAPQWSKR